MDMEVPSTPRRRRDDRPSGRLRKGLYIVPSLFTAANIAMGYYAILQVTHATATEPWHFDFAAKAIGFSVPDQHRSLKRWYESVSSRSSMAA